MSPVSLETQPPVDPEALIASLNRAFILAPMQNVRRLVIAVLLGWFAACGLGQSQTGVGPTFAVSDAALGKHVSVIVYGDMRFHDPSDTTVADPVARKELVERIAEEKPSAVQLTGDVPYRGSNAADYANYKLETEPWRAGNLRVYPAMGNHELAGGAEQGLENWWNAFPELRGKRWYSVALGSRIYLLQLDHVGLDGREPAACVAGCAIENAAQVRGFCADWAPPPTRCGYPDEDRGRP